MHDWGGLNDPPIGPTRPESPRVAPSRSTEPRRAPRGGPGGRPRGSEGPPGTTFRAIWAPFSSFPGARGRFETQRAREAPSDQVSIIFRPSFGRIARGPTLTKHCK